VVYARRAELADAAPLAELAERTFRDAFGDSNTSDDMDLHCRSHYSPEIQAAEIANPSCTTIVCEQQGELVGFGQICRSEAPSCVAGAAPAEIQRLYVDRRWHGKGVAQALMSALIDSATAAHADVVWLGVWENNPRAIAFYAKSGFVQVGEQEFLLGRDPQRDLVLSRPLHRR